MKKKNSKLPATFRAPEVWGAHYFASPYNSPMVQDADQHDKALRFSAGRLAYHAAAAMTDSFRLDAVMDAASMLREAALLLDVLAERQHARREP